MKTLILFSHTFYENSQANKTLLESIQGLENVIVHNLNATYSDGKINIQNELKLLSEATKIVAQFPFFWFSSPSLFKEWQDRVLSHIYHSENPKLLKGKTFQVITTAGGAEVKYSSWETESSGGVERALFPIYKSFEEIGAELLKPFVIYDALHTPLPLESYKQCLV